MHVAHPSIIILYKNDLNKLACEENLTSIINFIAAAVDFAIEFISAL